MQNRNNPPRSQVAAPPAAVIEGVPGHDPPYAQHLRAWGQLAVGLPAERRRALLAMPLIEDAPFDAPVPAPVDPNAPEPLCVAEHDDDGHEAPRFDLLGTIRGVQERLAWLGYEVDVTGRLDAATERALSLFQEDAAVPISKYPDEATRTALARRTFW